MAESIGAGRLQIVALAGARASGKTSIATVLRRAHGYEVRSFGDEVRRQAVTRGLNTDRESLRELGVQLIAEWGLDEFSQRVLAGASGPTVVEGVRHLEAVAALRRLAPVTLVFIRTSSSARTARLAARANEDLSAQAEQHSTELEVPQLESLADLVVDGDAIDQAAEQVALYVRKTVQLGS